MERRQGPDDLDSALRRDKDLASYPERQKRQVLEIRGREGTGQGLTTIFGLNGLSDHSVVRD